MSRLCSLVRNYGFGALVLVLAMMQPIYALDKNKADINLNTDLTRMNIVIGSTSSSTGCPAGQNWDINRGGCTSAVSLRNVSTSRACSCTCPQSGSCTSAQSGSYVVYGWRLPTDGRELISHNSATSWGSCSIISNACTEDTETGAGTPPPRGTTYIVEAFICNASHPQYNSGPLGSADKGRIISTYRSFNKGARCPEQGGFVYWQNQWLGWAREYQQETPEMSIADALVKAWTSKTQPTMRQAAKENGEDQDSYISVLNALCSSYGSQRFGIPVSATYINLSGSSCIVN